MVVMTRAPFIVKLAFKSYVRDPQLPAYLKRVSEMWEVNSLHS